jgi:hypothetical protein
VICGVILKRYRVGRGGNTQSDVDAGMKQEMNKENKKE